MVHDLVEHDAAHTTPHCNRHNSMPPRGRKSSAAASSASAADDASILPPPPKHFKPPNPCAGPHDAGTPSPTLADSPAGRVKKRDRKSSTTVQVDSSDPVAVLSTALDEADTEVATKETVHLRNDEQDPGPFEDPLYTAVVDAPVPLTVGAANALKKDDLVLALKARGLPQQGDVKALLAHLREHITANPEFIPGAKLVDWKKLSPSTKSLPDAAGSQKWRFEEEFERPEFTGSHSEGWKDTASYAPHF